MVSSCCCIVFQHCKYHSQCREPQRSQWVKSWPSDLVVVKRFTDIPINRGLNNKNIEPRFGFYRIGIFAIPYFLLNASECLISRKIDQKSIVFQGKSAFQKRKLIVVFRQRCYRCLGTIAMSCSNWRHELQISEIRSSFVFHFL